MISLKRKLLKNLANTYCRLKPSRYGVGVFAIRDIPKNINPFQNCREARWLKFSEKELNLLPDEIVNAVREFYGSNKGYIYIPYHGLNGNDISFYLNHSVKPNVIADQNDHNFITLRKIRKGKELFIDYRFYDPEDKILRN